MIAKRKASPYTPGERNTAWVKLKLDKQQEFVIGGCPSGHSWRGCSSDWLLRGTQFAIRCKSPGRLHTASAARYGLSSSRLTLIDARSSICRTAPYRTGGGGVTPEQMKEMHWLKPRLVAQVRFVEWTADGHLRHAAFLGLRTDKVARDIRRER